MRVALRVVLGRGQAAKDQHPPQSSQGLAGSLRIVTGDKELLGEQERVDECSVLREGAVALEEVVTHEVHVLVVEDDGRL